MPSPLRQLLAEFREASRTEREKGNYFVRLAVAFLKHDPAYRLLLFQRVIAVSLKTVKIVRCLPKLEIAES